MNKKRTIALMWYTLKEVLYTPIELLLLFKKAKTWNFILYAALIYTIYVKRPWIDSAVVLGFIAALYLIRQNKEPEFNRMMKEKAFLENDDEIITKFYNRYEEECFHSRPQRQPLEYDEWKNREIIKINERRNTEEDLDDAQY